MAILKCKMCGGDLNVAEGQTVCECDYCGSRQTVPTLDNEKKLTLFSRANRLRSMCEFDKAYGIYETIVSEFPEEAEAYWGLVLCKYGIEYVDDPATGNKIPTCHRSSFDNVMEDPNFEMVMEYADSIARGVYRTEAKEIERLRSGILEVSAKEQPYDIFICYKETDETGSRTIDSVIAQDVYTALTEKGYRVFFSRITLEDKLGQEYEPYIFAALHSAIIMLVFGTDYDYFNSVWVKNEWSRYLALIAKGEKKTLIPCYKDIDAYDMPQEFKRLQAQDMGKVGAMQDLLRGIEKIIPLQKEEKVKEIVRETVVVQQVSSAQGSTATSLLKRAFMMLEEANWEKADELLEQVLNIDPECGEAYLGKLMTERKVKTRDTLKDQQELLGSSELYRKAVRFGDDALAAFLRKTEEAIKENIYQSAMSEMHKNTEDGYIKADALLAQIPDYADVTAQRTICAIEMQKASDHLEELRKQRKELFKLAQRFIACTGHETIGLKVDGTLVVAGKDAHYYEGQIDDGMALLTGGIVKKADGTLTNLYGAKWSESKGLVACDGDGVGDNDVFLYEDGTVKVSGWESSQYNVSEWKNIIAVAEGDHFTVGVKEDGTVLAFGENTSGQCNVSEWRDIVAVAAGWEHTVGLKKNGTVVIAGYTFNSEDELNSPAEWRHIVSIVAYKGNTIALRADGTVVTNEICLKENVSKWTDIVAIAAGFDHAVGLKSDGTVVAAGYNFDGQCDVSGWKLFDSIETAAQEQQAAEEQRRRVAMEKAERKRKYDELKGLWWEKNKQIEAAQKELENLKGLFTGKRRKELETQIAEDVKTIQRLQNELKTLES